MAFPNRKRFNNRKNPNTDIRIVGDYIMQLYGFKEIPMQYFDTIKEYKYKVRPIKMKVNMEEMTYAGKEGKWPVSFNVFKDFKNKKPS